MEGRIVFIAVDLKVVEGLAAAVGRAGGMSEDAVLAGLVRLWHRCWADGADLFTTREISGLFSYDGGEQRALDALVAFGFLEPAKDLWRVRGAARYTRLKESRRRGGLKAKGNLRVGNSSSKSTSRVSGSKSRAAAGTPAGSQPGEVPALTPSHRVTESPNTEEKQDAPLSRTRLVSDRLVASFAGLRRSPYKFQRAKDGEALQRLLKACASDDEIDARWRRGLGAVGWQQVNTIAQLDSKWNDLTATATGPPAGAATSAATDWSDYRPGDTARELFGDKR